MPRATAPPKGSASRNSSAVCATIDRVFSVDGFGTIVTGTLIDGHIAVGDEAQLMPLGNQCRVRNLQVHGRDVSAVYAGQRAAVNLAGIKKESISRGDVLCRTDSMQPSLMLDVKLQNLPDSKRIWLFAKSANFSGTSGDCTLNRVCHAWFTDFA